MSFGKASENTIRQLNEIASKGLADFIWHLGDIGYADESWRVSPIWEFKYEIIFNQFMNSCQVSLTYECEEHLGAIAFCTLFNGKALLD